MRFDDRYLRPTEVDALIGDARRAADRLGWQANVHPAELARIMVDADLARLQAGNTPWTDQPHLDTWRG